MFITVTIFDSLLFLQILNILHKNTIKLTFQSGISYDKMLAFCQIVTNIGVLAPFFFKKKSDVQSWSN